MKKDIFFYLSIGFIFAICFIIIRQFFLYNVPEFFPQGFELGEIIFNLSISFIVTHWFYYLTVHRREKQYKEKAYKLVNNRASKIITSFNGLKQSIHNATSPILDATGIEMDTAFNYEQVLKFIYPDTFSGSYDSAFQPMAWKKRIITTNESIEKSLKDIFIVIPYLDSDDIELFTDLYSSEYLEKVNNTPLSGLSDLSFLGTPMFNFDEKIKVIEKRYNF